MYAKVNKTGMNDIANALGKYHKLGKNHFTAAMLTAWAQDAEHNFAEGRGCYFEISAHDSKSGAPVQVLIGADGYEVSEL